MKHGNQFVSISQIERLRARSGGLELKIIQLIGDKSTTLIETQSFSSMEGLAPWKLSPV